MKKKILRLNSVHIHLYMRIRVHDMIENIWKTHIQKQKKKKKKTDKTKNVWHWFIVWHGTYSTTYYKSSKPVTIKLNEIKKEKWDKQYTYNVHLMLVLCWLICLLYIPTERKILLYCFRNFGAENFTIRVKNVNVIGCI